MADHHPIECGVAGTQVLAARAVNIRAVNARAVATRAAGTSVVDTTPDGLVRITGGPVVCLHTCRTPS